MVYSNVPTIWTINNVHIQSERNTFGKWKGMRRIEKERKQGVIRSEISKKIHRFRHLLLTWV